MDEKMSRTKKSNPSRSILVIDEYSNKRYTIRGSVEQAEPEKGKEDENGQKNKRPA